tara:strand:- start:9020 stop:9388 length:369 start_codon:yes stop_codon:yes gene_type:complete
MSDKEGNPHSPDCIGIYAKQGKYAEKHIQTEEDEFPLAPTYLLPDGRVILVDFNVHMHDERGVTVNCYMTHWKDFDSIPYGGASAFRDEANFYDIFVPLDLILEHCDLSQVEYKLKDEEMNE